ncbi:MAG: hypothetical protein JWN48_883 [Myxococcaceae bacterium]|nr:hypothetical protein [Myxococcaceae bacterium]
MIQRRHARTLPSMLVSLLVASTSWAQAAPAAPASSASQAGSSLALQKLPAHLAFADPHDRNPGSGRGLIFTGWIALGIVAAAAAQGPLCSLNTYDARDGQRSCVNSSIGVGVAALVLGVPALVLGYRRRSAQNEWKERHGLRSLAPRMSIAPAARGVLFGYQLAAF